MRERTSLRGILTQPLHEGLAGPMLPTCSLDVHRSGRTVGPPLALELELVPTCRYVESVRVEMAMMLTMAF